MSAAPMIDAQRLSLMLNELRLPTIKHIWGDFAVQADKEGFFKQSVKVSTKGNPNALIRTDFKLFPLKVDQVVRLDNI